MAHAKSQEETKAAVVKKYNNQTCVELVCNE